jgi:hypothetical protein
VSGVLNLLGFHIGRQSVLMPANESNPKGYWEHQLLTDLNDELLSRLGGTWHTPPAFPSGWQNAPEIEDIRQRARALIQEEFGPHKFWGWKDPRNCLLLPFWQPLLPPMRYLICLRNPVEVAKSLLRRDGFSVEKSFDLWLLHVKSALVHTENRPRLFVRYEELLADPHVELQRIGDFLGKSELVRLESTRQSVREFIDIELRHNQADLMDVVHEPRLAYEEKSLSIVLQLTLNILEAGEKTGESTKQLHHILNRLSECAWDARVEFKSKMAELEVTLGRQAEMESQLKSQQAENRRLNEVVRLAEQWQSSWFRRAFHRWHPPGAKRESIGLLKKLERSICKRLKLFSKQSPKP